jgi:hypothetical protein
MTSAFCKASERSGETLWISPYGRV